MRVFPHTLESYGVTDADVSALTERTPKNCSFLEADDDGGSPVPLYHPNLPDGHGLFCQVDLTDGSTATYCCNNLLFMQQQRGMVVSGAAKAIRWYTGPAHTVSDD